MKAPAAGLAAALLALAAGCGSPDRENGARVWTLSDLDARAATGGAVGGRAARDFVTPAGQPLPWLSPPYEESARIQNGAGAGLNVVPAFSEGQPAAYVVTTVWQGVDEAWIQPWYVTVTDSPSGPQRVPGSLAIIDVARPSFFDTSFWQIVDAFVPPATGAERLRSAADLFAEGLRLDPAGPLLATASPGNVSVAVADGAGGPVRPLSGEAVAAPRSAAVWLKGGSIQTLVFGSSGFTWDFEGRVGEVALFRFVQFDGSAGTRSLGLPDVVGTGPLGTVEGVPELGPNGGPRFGAFSQLVEVTLPPSAGVFVPSSHPSFRALLGARAPAPAAAIDRRAGLGAYLGRVALDPSCFQDVSGFPGSCRWLDSQASIERELAPSALVPRAVYFTSPLVEWGGVPVPR